MSTPLDINTAYAQDKKRIKDVNGDGVFISSYEGAAYHIVNPGSFVLIPFTNKPGDEKQFAVTLGTTPGCKIDVQ